ncbi:MAG: hypothetical protein KJZ47_03530 [Gemmatimonadales bacterium]|nr:hypothetical protein [Gemmatimonadales bacterium]
MDKQALAVMIPVLAVFFTGLVVLSRTVIGKAIARRIGGDQQTGDDVHQHLVELETEVALMRQELTETQERLDFAERLLAKRDERVGIGAARREE